MSDDLLFNDGYEDEPEDEETEAFDADPGVVAFMDQQTAAFNAAEHEFEDRFGFVHKCHCDQDYSDGKLVEVTECYAGMIEESLAACETLMAENKLLRRMIVTAFAHTIGDSIGFGNVESESTEQPDEGPETD